MIVAGVSCLAVLLALSWIGTPTSAACPFNGDPRLVYLTFNGDGGFNNMLMLDTAGNVLGSAIDAATWPASVPVYKLRAIAKGPDQRLYVAAALGVYSKIVALSADVSSENCTRRFESVFTSVHQRSNPLMVHPYAMEFSRATGTLFVANQNTLSVTRYASPLSANPGQPLDLAAGSPLPPSSPPGAFVTKRTPLSFANGTGLLASVRGIALTNGDRFLIVADVDGDALHLFTGDSGRHIGTLMASSVKLNSASSSSTPVSSTLRLGCRSPIQIVAVARQSGAANSSNVAFEDFFVTSKARGVICNLRVFSNGTMIGHEFPRSTGMSSTSGIWNLGLERSAGAETKPASLLVADRVGSRLFRVDPATAEVIQPFGPHRFDDEPEHIFVDRVMETRRFPICYELGPLGMQVSSLCKAGAVYAGLAIATVVWLAVLRVTGRLSADWWRLA